MALLDKELASFWVKVDSFGNRFVKVGASSTLFTSHVDTVHYGKGESSTQSVILDANLGIVYSPDGEVLGADDAAGMWLMVEMIRTWVPGTYAFFRGEECGGLGSADFLENHPDLSTYERCVSFDRAGTTDVITHQGGIRTASDVFALALCQQLGMGFTPCTGGVFTDSKVLAGVVPECTNISVGYERQHTSQEVLDVQFLQQLLEKCLTVDWESLPTQRNPLEREDLWESHWTYKHTHQSDLDLLSEEELIQWATDDPQGFVNALIAEGRI